MNYATDSPNQLLRYSDEQSLGRALAQLQHGWDVYPVDPPAWLDAAPLSTRHNLTPEEMGDLTGVDPWLLQEWALNDMIHFSGGEYGLPRFFCFDPIVLGQHRAQA